MTEMGKTVCALCREHVEPKDERKIPTPRDHYAFGMAARVTVCKTCAKSAKRARA